MAQEIEIEYKNLLTKEEYDRIMTALDFPVNGVTQTNHYFETHDFSLQANKSALRIREKNGAYRLTLKEPYKYGLLETHDTLSRDEAEAWISGNPIAKKHTTSQLRKIGIQPVDLYYYGSLVTHRHEFTKAGLIFVLDYSTYNGVVDYELEMEAPNEEIGYQTFHELLSKLNITKKDTPNKIERFFRTLK